jgi:hypothetical protein
VLNEAPEVANDNARDEGPHELSSGEYVTLLCSNQSSLSDYTLLAIFSRIYRLRRSKVVTELLESCHDSSRNTNKDGTLAGGAINDSQLKFPGAHPSDPSCEPKRPLPSRIITITKTEKAQKRLFM